MFGLVRRVFRKRPQGVTRTLSVAKQGGAERPGDGCPCRSEEGAEPRANPAGVAVDSRGFRVRPVPSELWRGGLSPSSLLLDGWGLAAYQSVTPVRASPNTAVN